jgi:hypothetical protein
VTIRDDCGCGGGRLHRRRFLQLGAGTALGATFLGASGGLAGAAPRPPRFGPRIDPYAAYDGQDTCDPTPKPGTVALKNLLLATYPGTVDWGISRDCSSGGVSEHKEGRAFDWGVPDEAGKRAARNFVTWLLKRDEYGNKDAMARRLGIMYLIHDGKTWQAWDADAGLKPRDCDPHASYDDCHFQHVHFSLSWDGAYQRTTWWHPENSRDGADTRYWQDGAAGRVGGAGEAVPSQLSC